MKLMSNAILVVAMAACAGMGSAADLQINVAGLASASGKVTVSLYASAAEFLKAPARVASIPAQQGVTLVVFKDIPAGAYAVSAYHDENGNDAIDRGSMGIPTEPFGFGNDAAGAMGPPTFEQARVEVPASGASVSLSVRADGRGASR